MLFEAACLLRLFPPIPQSVSHSNTDRGGGGERGELEQGERQDGRGGDGGEEIIGAAAV